MDNSPRIIFILSAGRTGTVFLTDALGRKLPGAMVVHEPWPGRYGLILANMRRKFGTSGRLLRLLLKVGLKARLKRAIREKKSCYIEANPFLCACVDLLPDLGLPFSIIHMVRAPESWASSITSFRASGYRRWLIPFIPFAMPFPEPRPAGWRSLTNMEKALWRWQFCNEEIIKLKHSCPSYMLLRYEDVFSDDPRIRQQQAEKISIFLDRADDRLEYDIQQRLNSSTGLPPVRDGAAKQFINTVTGALARQLGYRHDPG